MIKLKDLLEASKTGTTSSSEQLGGYRGFVKEEDFEKYKKYMGNKAPKGSILVEGVDDPGIFKAVFLAGGPGSGKTWVAKGLFGIPDRLNISHSGLKMVNSDKELKFLLKKFGFGTDLDKMPDELFKQLTDPKDKDYSGLRDFSKSLTKQRMKQYKKGKLGMIVDGTGHDFSKLSKMKKDLEKEGYDSYMIFVNTSLEVAQKRNQERDRILPPKLLEKSWKDVQKNLGRFQNLFKQDFLIVDNSKHLEPEDATKKFNILVKKGIDKFVKKPIKNPIAKKWIKKQQILKKQGK
jgi:predicted kinase